jgi:hypothetical protein
MGILGKLFSALRGKGKEDGATGKPEVMPAELKEQITAPEPVAAPAPAPVAVGPKKPTPAKPKANGNTKKNWAKPAAKPNNNKPKVPKK